jgi:hypothetical protein
VDELLIADARQEQAGYRPLACIQLPTDLGDDRFHERVGGRISQGDEPRVLPEMVEEERPDGGQLLVVEQLLLQFPQPGYVHKQPPDGGTYPLLVKIIQNRLRLTDPFIFTL